MSENNIMSKFKWTWFTKASWSTQLTNYIKSNLSNRAENLSHGEICRILDKFSEAKDAPDFDLVKQIYGRIENDANLKNYFVQSVYNLYKVIKNKKDDLDKLVNDSDFRPILIERFGVFVDFKSDDSWTGITYAHQINDFIKRKRIKRASDDEWEEDLIEDENFVLDQKDIDWIFEFLKSKKAGFNFDLISTATKFVKDNDLKINFVERIFEHNQECAYFDDYEKCLDNTLKLFMELVLDFSKQNIDNNLEAQKAKIDILFDVLSSYKLAIDFKFVESSMAKLSNNMELKKYLAQKIFIHGQNIGFINEIEDWGNFLNLLVTENLDFEFGNLLKLAYDYYVVRNGSTFAEFIKRATMSQIVDLNDYVSILINAANYNIDIDFDLLKMMLDKQETEQRKTELMNYVLRQIQNGENGFENELFNKILDSDFTFDIKLLFGVMVKTGHIKQIADLTNFIKKAGARIQFNDVENLIDFYKIVFNSSRGVKNGFWNPLNLFGALISLGFGLSSLKSNVRTVDFTRISGKDFKSVYENTVKVFDIKLEDLKINTKFVLDQFENNDSLLSSCFDEIKLPKDMEQERVKNLKNIFVFSIKNIVIKSLKNRLSELNSENAYNSFVDELSVLFETVKGFCLDMQDKKIETAENLIFNLKKNLSCFDKALLLDNKNRDVFIKSCCDLLESANLLNLLDSSLKLPGLTENEQKFYVDRVKAIICFFVGKVRATEENIYTSDNNGESLLSQLLSCDSLDDILSTMVFPNMFKADKSDDISDQEQLRDIIKDISSEVWKTFSCFIEKNLLKKKNITVKEFASKLAHDTVPLRTKLVKFIYTLKNTNYDSNDVVDRIKDIVKEFEKEDGLLEKYDFKAEYKEFIVNITKSVLLIGQKKAGSWWKKVGFWLFDKWVFSENNFDKFSRYIRDEDNKMPISKLLDSFGNENLISVYVDAIKFLNKLYGSEYNWKKAVNVMLAVILFPLYVAVFCPIYSIYNLCTKRKISEQIESVNEHNPAIPRLDQNNERRL